MARLGKTISALKRGSAGNRGSAPPTRLLRQDFGPNPGALTMLTYVPEALPEGSPLVVVVHGCGQEAEGHAAAAGWLALADRLGFAVIAPQQSSANNANLCFNWFERGDTVRGKGEAASIHAMVTTALAAYSLDPTRVYVTGLSAGGAMAAVMLATYPDVFAGGAVVAGLPYGVATNMHEALQAMRGASQLTTAQLADRLRNASPGSVRWPRLCVWHGDRDHTVAPSAATALTRQWAAAQGLAAAPDRIELVNGRSRARWCSPEGEILIECHMVPGIGHGTPLATREVDSVGFTAPFMLEASISSAWTTARFWGLAPELIGDASLSPDPVALHTDLGGAANPHTPVLAETVLASTAPHVDPAVQAIIERALGAAGLMR